MCLPLRLTGATGTPVRLEPRCDWGWLSVPLPPTTSRSADIGPFASPLIVTVADGPRIAPENTAPSFRATYSGNTRTARRSGCDAC